MSEKQGKLKKQILHLCRLEYYGNPDINGKYELDTNMTLHDVMTILDEAKVELNEALRARKNELTCEDAYDRVTKTVKKWFGETTK